LSFFLLRLLCLLSYSIMKKQFYRSLDRTIDIFGIRGTWIRNFLVVLGVLVTVGFLLGSIFGATVGYSIIIVGGVIDFFVCLFVQSKIPSRRFDKLLAESKMEQVIIRRETLSRIVYDDPNWIRKNKDKR